MNENIPGMANGPLTQEPIVVYRKSSRSLNNPAACVEVATIAAQAGDVSPEVLDNVKADKGGRLSSTVKGK